MHGLKQPIVVNVQYSFAKNSVYRSDPIWKRGYWGVHNAILASLSNTHPVRGVRLVTLRKVPSIAPTERIINPRGCQLMGRISVRG